MVERANRKVSASESRPWGWPHRMDNVSAKAQMKTTLYIDGQEAGQVIRESKTVSGITITDDDRKGYMRGNGVNSRTAYPSNEATSVDNQRRYLRIVWEPNR